MYYPWTVKEEQQFNGDFLCCYCVDGQSHIFGDVLKAHQL